MVPPRTASQGPRLWWTHTCLVSDLEPVFFKFQFATMPFMHFYVRRLSCIESRFPSIHYRRALLRREAHLKRASKAFEFGANWPQEGRGGMSALANLFWGAAIKLLAKERFPMMSVLIRKRPSLEIIALCAPLILSACLGPKKDPTRYYSLGFRGSSQAETLEAVLENRPSISLRVSIAQYLQKPHYTIRKQQEELIYKSHHRWAEPLQVAIETLLLSAIQGKSGGFRLIGQDEAGNSQMRVTHRLNLDIQHFEYLYGKGVFLKANWKIHGKGIGKYLIYEKCYRSSLDETSSVNDQVKGLRRLLDQLSLDVAQSLEALTAS